MSLNIEFETIDAGSVLHVKASSFVLGWDAFIRPAPAAWAGQSGHFYEFQSKEVYLDALSIAESMAEDELSIVPAVVRMAAARVALIDAGLLDQVEYAIESLPEPNRAKVRSRWEYEANVRRGDSMVAFIRDQLSLTDDTIDALFITAAGL